MERLIACLSASAERPDPLGILAPPVAGGPQEKARSYGAGGFACRLEGPLDRLDLAVGPRFTTVLHGAVFHRDDDPPVRLGAHGGQSGRSDAQALSDLWADVGPRALDLLRGSFAGLVYDAAERELTFFRDPIGVRPLFYAVRGEEYIFGTEAREVQSHLPERGEVDRGALVGLMLRCHSALDRQSSLRGVLRVPPGCLCRLRRTNNGLRLNLEPYWRPEAVRERPRISEVEACEELRRVLTTAVLRSAWAPRSVVSMSGGLDSTAIWALATDARRQGLLAGREVDCMSVVFPDQDCDESDLIAAVHQHLETRSSALIDGGGLRGFDQLAPRIARELDSPQFPTDYFTFLVAEAGSQLGTGGLITGLCADQLLYRTLEYLGEDLARFRLRSFSTGLVQLARVPNRHYSVRTMLDLPRRVLWHFREGIRGATRRLPQRPVWLADSAWNEFLGRGFQVARGQPTGRRDRWPYRAIERTLRELQLPGEILHREEMLVRRLGLSHEIPFLDRDLVELVLSLPNSVAQASGWNKGLLRRVSSSMLPASIAWRTTRTQFDSLFSVDLMARALPASVASWRLVQNMFVDPNGLDRLATAAHNEWESRGRLIQLWCVELFVRSVGASGRTGADE